MSDGGEESKKRESDYKASKRTGTDDYARAVSRVAIAQICESVGFESFKDSALETLSDVAVRFICDLGKSSVCYSNLSGRSESNVFDIINGLEDLASTKGFLGASVLDYCATTSGALKEVVDYVGTVEEIPFVQPIPWFPVSKSCKEFLSFLQMADEPSGKHIPAWLPPFPDPRTYLNSPMWNERETDSPADKIEQVKQRRKADKSLSRLHQRLVSGVWAGPSGFANHINPLEELGMEVNPFLAPALPAGEKEVSHITVPNKLVNKESCKKHDPFLEMFAPANNIMKAGEMDSVDIDRRFPLEKRPIVHFRFKAVKKILGEDLDVSIGNRGSERRAPTIRINQERDEKKRKAQLIVRQSMENPQ